MSNITKAFQAKQGLRSANLPGYAGGFVQKLFGGGKPAPAAPVVDPRLAQIEASQRALQQSQGTYGSAPAAVAAPVVSAAPTQQVAPVGVSLSSAVGSIESNGEALNAAAGDADGIRKEGLAHPRATGKGGGCDGLRSVERVPRHEPGRGRCLCRASPGWDAEGRSGHDADAGGVIRGAGLSCL